MTASPFVGNRCFMAMRNAVNPQPLFAIQFICTKARSMPHDEL
jgi:hypothetical protein